MAERKNKEKQYTEPLQTEEEETWEPQTNHWFQTARQLAGQLESRPAFSYDPAADPLYLGARQEYLRQGRRAMADAAGKAAGLTGGYGSTYAQSQGQQAYDAQLLHLASLLPTYYDRAKEAYDSEGKQIRDVLGVATGLYDKEYQAYLDRLAESRREREFETDNAHWQMNFDEKQRQWEQENSQDQQRWEQEFAWDQQRWAQEYAQDAQQWQDKQQSTQASQAASEAARNRSYAYKMAMLALQQGLKVSDSLLATAGIDKSYAELIRSYYAAIRSGK